MNQFPPQGPYPTVPPPRRGSGAFFAFLALIFFSLAALALFVMFFLSGESEDSLTLFGDRVAVVELHGAILDVEDWVDLLEECEEEDEIVAVVLDIDSPGGAIAPTQRLCEAIEKIKAEGKPVVAALGSVAASGGYYVASAADEIVAMPGTLTGSIGVYVQLMNLTDLLEKVGVEFDFVKKGEFKTAGDFSRDLEEDERAMFQSVVDDYYDQFLEAVVEGRKSNRLSLARGWDRPIPGTDASATGKLAQWGGVLYPSAIWGQESGAGVSGVVAASSKTALSATVELESATASLEPSTASLVAAGTETATATATVDPLLRKLADSLSDQEIANRVSQLAEGRIYTGRQAEALGLVDSLGTLEDAIKSAGKKAGIEGEPKTVEKTVREESGLFGRLESQVSLFKGSKFLYFSPLGY
jgi:protease-4